MGLCPCVVSEVMWSVAVTVMRAMLFVLHVLHVCMLRVCEDARVTAMLVWGMDEVWL